MMTIQERQKRAMIKKRKQIAKRRMILLLAALFVITLGSVVFGTIFSKAKNPTADITQYKYYIYAFAIIYSILPSIHFHARRYEIRSLG